MKTLIVTIAIGETHEKLGLLTHPLMQNYAQKIGADFAIMNTLGNHTMPHYRKLDLGDLLEEYDRVCYLDTDIIVRPDAPNIFDIVPYNAIGAFEEGRYEGDRAATLHAFMKQMGYEHDVEERGLDYYNTGVLVVSRCHRPAFLQPLSETPNFYEQTYLNFCFQALRVKMCCLSHLWNRMSLTNQKTGDDMLTGYFIHYAGYGDVHGPEFLLETVKADIDRLMAAPMPYRFPKKILIAVQGGIGDQVDAEPAVRYLTQDLMPGNDFHLASYWPDLFSHLPGVKLYNRIEDIEGATEMYVAESYRNHEHDSWHYMSHARMHTTDFASIQLMKCTLPLSKKRIKLVAHPDEYKSMMEKVDRDYFQDTVLVHPGKTWPSRTFPSDVWQSYIDELLRKNFTVIVMGKRMPDKNAGIVELDLSRCIDAIDKLTLKEMIALIDKCPILISNDSSPIHIAGAFNNWIGVISTTRRPEHILPHRGPLASPFWRARSLEAAKFYEMRRVLPTEVDPMTLDGCTNEEIRACCPHPSVIGDFAARCLFEEDQGEIPS